MRNRIQGLRFVRADALIANEKNWRTHPKRQQDVLKGLIEEVGFADAVIARELQDGTLRLIDGHLRTETAGSQEIPVIVVDVNDEEEAKLLATFDPLSEMAGTNADALMTLLEGVETDSKHISEMLSKLIHQTDVLREEQNFEVEDDTEGDGVRMVQLFLTEDNIADFHGRVMAIGEKYGTTNITDTVLEAMRRASLRVQRED